MNLIEDFSPRNDDSAPLPTDSEIERTSEYI